MNTGKVSLGNINPGKVSDGFWMSEKLFTAYDSNNRRVLGHAIPYRGSGLVDIYRNFVVDIFLQLGDEYLFFVDSDITLEVDTCYRLLDLCNESTPVVTGVYPTIGPKGKIIPTLYTLGHNDKGEYTMLPWEGTLGEPPLMEVDGCGAGCLMIHRSILEKMQANYPPNKAWFDNLIYNDVPYGEDLTFCMRVKEMGYKVYCAPDVWVRHEKSINLSLPEEYRGTSS